MPPKKKKNAPKNSYYFYMIDYKEKKESEGVSFPGGLKEVADAASASWKGLDPKTKHHYEKMAERAKVAGSGGTRYNTQGQTFEEADADRLERNRQHQEMLRVVKDSVESGGREGLKSRRFYLFHVNHYGTMEDSHFIPCEVAVLAYSIEKGYQPENIFHEFIKNFELPTGYTYKAKTHMEATHRCPLPPQALGTCQVHQIIEKICKLMEKNGDMENGIPPPLYTLERLLPECVDFFAYIQDGFGKDAKLPYRIYPLEDLFFKMKNFCLKPQGERLCVNGIEDAGFPFRTTAEDILKDDIYDYSPHLACEFHEEQDVRQHCSKSYVIRWSYLFSDHLCANLDVKMKRTSHTMKSANLNASKITSCLEHLRLGEHQDARESYGRGRGLEGSSSRIPQASGRGRAREIGSALSLSNPFTVLDHSEGESDDDDHDAKFKPLTQHHSAEDAPLRQPKSAGKSSMMLDAMRSPRGEAELNPSFSGLSNYPVGRGRGRGQGLFLPSGKVVDDFNN